MLDKNAYPLFQIQEQIRITGFHSLFQIHYDCGFEFSGETHDFWECLYVLEGELCVSADERVYNMTAGDLIFHKPLEFHKFTIQNETGATLLIFSYSAEGPLTAWLCDKVFQLSFSQKERIHSLLNYMQSKTSPIDIRTFQHDYYLQPFSKVPYYSQIIANDLCQLFLILAEKGTLSTVSSSPDAITFRNAINLLNANLDQQPTVREIAKQCNTSEASLKRVFDKYAGIGVHQYLLKLKINVAKKMLQAGGQVFDVSEKLGFTSQSYFSKAFKREIGVSPSNFVKQEKVLAKMESAW